MIALRLGERQRFTNKTRDTLTKRKIPMFLVSCLTGFLAHRMMGAFGQDRLISLPEGGVGATAAISGRDGCHNRRQVAALRSPITKATICRVRRHKAVHSQRSLSR